eukprot:2997003-Rhodomonas_salina.3
MRSTWGVCCVCGCSICNVDLTCLLLPRLPSAPRSRSLQEPQAWYCISATLLRAAPLPSYAIATRYAATILRAAPLPFYALSGTDLACCTTRVALARDFRYQPTRPRYALRGTDLARAVRQAQYGGSENAGGAGWGEGERELPFVGESQAVGLALHVAPYDFGAARVRKTAEQVVSQLPRVFN